MQSGPEERVGTSLTLSASVLLTLQLTPVGRGGMAMVVDMIAGFCIHNVQHAQIDISDSIVGDWLIQNSEYALICCTINIICNM